MRGRGPAHSCIRAADTAARFGGDEFVVLLEDVDEQHVGLVSDRILEVMNEPFRIQGREVFIGASIGIAIGGSEADDLLRNADLALYRAKSKGKGQEQVYEPQMHAAMVERMELEESLARALRNDELHPPLPADPRAAQPAAGRESRRWCAGSTRPAACCSRASSSRSPRTAG